MKQEFMLILRLKMEKFLLKLNLMAMQMLF